MVDPVSGMLIAFTAVKKGISMGKELHSMSKDLNNLFSFIDGAKEAKQKNDKSDPLSSYIAYEKAMDYEKQLKDIIISTRGIKGWNKFEQFRREAKKNERETRYAAIRKRNEILNILSIIFAVCIVIAGAIGLFYFAYYLRKL